MSKTDKAPTPLSVMLGDGGSFLVKGRAYNIKPIALKDIEDFMNDNLSMGSQIFNITNKDSRAKVDKWLSKYCFGENDDPISLEKAMEYNWDVIDLKEFFKKLCDFSG